MKVIRLCNEYFRVKSSLCPPPKKTNNQIYSIPPPAYKLTLNGTCILIRIGFVCFCFANEFFLFLEMISNLKLCLLKHRRKAINHKEKQERSSSQRLTFKRLSLFFLETSKKSMTASPTTTTTRQQTNKIKFEICTLL